MKDFKNRLPNLNHILELFDDKLSPSLHYKLYMGYRIHIEQDIITNIYNTINEKLK